MPRRSRPTFIASLLAAACLGAGGGAVAYATLSGGDTVVKQVTVKQAESVASSSAQWKCGSIYRKTNRGVVEITVSTTGWKIVHGILGVLFIIVGFYAIWHPYDTFATLAALVGLFLLFRGIFDITVAFVTKDEFELWWLQLIAGIAQILLAFWVAGNWQNKAILLVVYVGIVALMRGITEIFLAFKLRGVRKKLASA